MSDQIFFTPDAGSGYLPLSRTKSGRLVRKEILKEGPLFYGGKTIQLTADKLDEVVKNFDAKVADIVQFPIVDADNKHTEDPFRNAGEVVKLEHKDNSLFAYIDVRKEEAQKGIEDKTLIGASAMLAMDYVDTRTGKKAGPTLLHVAGTNRPHVTDLADFELIAASVDTNGEAILLTATNDSKETQDMPKTKDELFAELKSEHDIDVQALLDSASNPAGDGSVAALSASLSDAGILKLANGETASADDLVLAVGQLVEDRTELSNRVEALETADKEKTAAARVDKAIEDGFISEATREGHLKIALSNGIEAFEALLPEQPIIKLSGDADGFVPADSTPSDTVQAEIDRYSAIPA